MAQSADTECPSRAWQLRRDGRVRMLEDDRPATESGSHPHSSPVGTGPSDVLGWHGVSVEVQWHDDEALVLIVSGEIDVLTAPQLQEAIELALSNRPGALVLDLSEVTFLSSAGMGVLIACQQLAGDQT